MSTEPRTPFRRPLFDRGTWPEVSRIGDILRTESVGGFFFCRWGDRAGVGQLGADFPASALAP